eukprot:3306450-Prymnesium_polylepis.2
MQLEPGATPSTCAHRARFRVGGTRSSIATARDFGNLSDLLGGQWLAAPFRCRAAGRPLGWSRQAAHIVSRGELDLRRAVAEGEQLRGRERREEGRRRQLLRMRAREDGARRLQL